MTWDTEDLIKYRISRSFQTIKEAETMIRNGNSIEFIQTSKGIYYKDE